ncbi:MAG TPA: hypothetical protein PKD26_08910 [Pyrinomonadaceae bacterium]|nr:hypothetical protein [Pyrinomonadaceae bacterium]
MEFKTVWIAAAACFLGFVGGFMLANSLNRSGTMISSNSEVASNNIPDQDALRAAATLTPDEIRSRIESADKNPRDFTFQKSLGLSLYRYASLKQDSAVLPETIRIMQRALDLDPADRDLQIGLGNAHFDLGYFNKDNASFEQARKFYRKALERVTSDVDVRCDLALTYFLNDPPDLETAINEFEKGLEFNARHERSLQFLTQTYIKAEKIGKAGETLERLRSVNPSNPTIQEFALLLSQDQPAGK